VLTKFFLQRAADELKIEGKLISEDTQIYLNGLNWPGNVRQLENFCRWVTVMASGKEIHKEDLPPELKVSEDNKQHNDNWEENLRSWVESNLVHGQTQLLTDAVPRFERIMIEEALKKSGGRRQDAAKLLGWGRNTLTRKIKSLGLDS
jgi:two-component system nitrogen regulation response regulator GlnG